MRLIRISRRNPRRNGRASIRPIPVLQRLLGIIFVLAAGFAILWSTVYVKAAKAEYAPAYRSETWNWGWGACDECRRQRAIIRRQRERERRWAAEREERRAHEWQARQAAIVYRVNRHRDRDDDDDRCRPRLAVVGDQYASESGAQSEADKAWMQTARWQWGERYMAREHAADASYECGRSSVGSVVGQVFYRCRLSAKPCKPEPQPGK